jgi:Uma2 family endonuclease
MVWCAVLIAARDGKSPMVQPATLPPLVRGEWVPMSYETFLEWAPEGLQGEWVDGKGMIFVTSSERHVRFLLLFTNLLSAFVDAFQLGRVIPAPFQMRLGVRPSGREPDLMVVLTKNLDRVRRYWLEGPADFVIEFVSEHTADNDLRVKVGEFEAARVPEYVAVETREGRDGVYFYRLDEGGRLRTVEPDRDGRLHSTVLPGFWFDPRWLMEDPLPTALALLRRISPEAWLRLVSEGEEETGAG